MASMRSSESNDTHRWNYLMVVSAKPNAGMIALPCGLENRGEVAYGGFEGADFHEPFDSV